ncbi:MAG TPA: HAD-IA family hydrolase [Mycobacteriales bacterium]|nr:HAD-IA family hydrolase [Mycobacteriales bacterium]
MRPGRAVEGRPGAVPGVRAAAVPPVIDLNRMDGAVFDIDGVVTDTARVHAAAWKRTFDSVLRRNARRIGKPMKPFDLRADYLRYVDGRPRLDGLRGFLAARGIVLPEGKPTDQPGAFTVYGQARRKDEYFLDRLHRHGVLAFGSTVDLLRQIRTHGAVTAAVSSSRNAAEVLASAGVTDLFDVRVDGRDAMRMGLAGKPDPALFIEAARRLGSRPDRLVVVEDALAGVEAGCRGGFGLVVGVDRGSHSADLHRAGAHVVVTDLAQLSLRGRRG